MTYIIFALKGSHMSAMASKLPATRLFFNNNNETYNITYQGWGEYYSGTRPAQNDTSRFLLAPTLLLILKWGKYPDTRASKSESVFISWNHVDGLVQERRNSIANALELRLSCTNPSMWGRPVTFPRDPWQCRWCGCWGRGCTCSGLRWWTEVTGWCFHWGRTIYKASTGY